jgi:hypothetical protein
MKTGVIIFICAGIFGCSGTKVITMTGPKAKFQNYLTYRIAHPPYPEDSTNLNATILKSKIDGIIQTHFNARGYKLIQPADLVISYKLILDNKVDYNVNDTYNPTYRNRYDQYGNNRYPYNLNERPYTEGTLLVEIREDYGNAAVWDGSLDLKYNSKKSDQDPVVNAFNLIFIEYNYTAGQSEPVAPDLN